MKYRRLTFHSLGVPITTILKGKDITNAQKIIKWREKLPPGTEYKVQTLLKETELSDKQFQKVKSNNEIVAKIFENDRTDKKGYYRVS